MALPPLSEQQRIVDVMSAIDDLAECQLKILEQIDRIVPTIARLSIDMSSVTTEHKLTDLVTITNGYSYTSAELVDESATALVNLKNFARTGGFRLDGLKPLDGSPKSSQVLMTGDILLAKTDLTQDAEVVGRCMRMPNVHGFTTFVASLDAAILRPTSAVSKEALLALLSLSEFRDHCLGYANGTTVLHLSKDALPAYTVTLPDEEQMTRLSATIASLGAQQDHALSELHAATSLHDFLLPRLLSGELRVSGAEKQLEEAS
jgi:type I restriction enzyme S subunit